VGEVDDYEAHLTMGDLELALKEAKNMKFPSIDILTLSILY
jgi:hypothetical protein